MKKSNYDEYCQKYYLLTNVNHKYLSLRTHKFDSQILSQSYELKFKWRQMAKWDKYLVLKRADAICISLVFVRMIEIKAKMNLGALLK